MPVDPDLPRSEWATLAQAVRWVAFGLVPRPERFERLEDYPRYVGEKLESSFGEIGDALEYNVHAEKCKDAKLAINKQLLLGKLQAEGRKGIAVSGTEPVWPSHLNSEDPSVQEYAQPEYYVCRDHEVEYSSIPAELWHLDNILWDSGCIHQQHSEEAGDGSPIVTDFIDVRVKTADLLRIFPPATDNDGAVPQSAKRPAGKPGRLPKYDKVAFFRLYALEAEVDAAGVLRTLPGFRERMSDLWYEMYGEPRPGDIWIGDRFTELNKDREKFKAARKRLDDP